MSDEIPHSGIAKGDTRYKHEMVVDGRGVTLNVIAFAQMYVQTGKGEFRSCGVPMSPQTIPSSGETVWRMDLSGVEETITRLRADGIFDQEERYLAEHPEKRKVVSSE